MAGLRTQAPICFIAFFSTQYRLAVSFFTIDHRENGTKASFHFARKQDNAF